MNQAHPRPPLRVGLAQLKPTKGDVAANMERVRAVTIEAASRNPPRDSVGRQMKLCQFIDNVDELVAVLRWHFVSEPDTVVENAYSQAELPARRVHRFEADQEFAMPVRDPATLTPGLLPNFGAITALAAGDAESVIETGLVAKAKAEP